ncbi:ComEC family competence protein [Lentimicrobium sp. L6]|uniref:ComEC/Rec2 family competence protein n=1 Tax=Lentimicrobium sp. L6 TaxID=2735916 RepID=UPI001553C9FD|nr:ComEC/Rec2 family competence protein [Lentimicrobium sp. L6]NPD83492.1 ComEC family competence protein [Lentimicrobium sp. L6]
MKFWNDYPLLRILLPLIIGILLAFYYPNIILPFWSLFILTTILLFWAFRPLSLRKFSIRIIGGIVISLLFLLIGNQLTEVKTEKYNHLHYSNHDSVSHLIIRINSPLTEKRKSFKATGLVIGGFQENDTNAIKLQGKILIYFEKVNFIKMDYGDEILIAADKLQAIRNLGNPNEFDFTSYLKKQNIHHHVFLTKTDWITTNHQSPNLIKLWSLNTRNHLLKLLENMELGDSEFGVASALLLGYDEYLDPDLRQKYAGSGAMHILCVSGLHVGIIFMIFNVLFAPLRKTKYGSYLNSLLIITLIWLYALITGLSPSVFRSTTMFSFIIIGSLINRKTSTYNSLAASAVVLLINDPFLIFQIGFQLSYLAVLAILFIQPPLSKLYYFKNGFLTKTKDLIAVSIAAQIGTFPLAIYYFHQFPNYFILTNLIVIPLSFAILLSGFATIFIHALPFLKSILGLLSQKILYWLLFILNSSIGFINQMPYAVSRNLYFTFWDTLLVYFLILFLILALMYKKAKILIVFLSIAIILMVSNAYLRMEDYEKEFFIIYHVPKASLVEWSTSNKSQVIMDTSLFNSQNYERYLYESQLYRRIDHTEYLTFDSIYSSSCINFDGRLIFILDKSLQIPENAIHLNYLYLRNNPKISLHQLSNKLSFDTIIMDGSNKYWNVHKWKMECDSLRIPYFDTKEKGAFMIENSF